MIVANITADMSADDMLGLMEQEDYVEVRIGMTHLHSFDDRRLMHINAKATRSGICRLVIT